MSATSETTLSNPNQATELTESVPCLICGNDQATPYIELEESIQDIGGSFTLQKCGSCDHIYLSPRPTPEDIGRFYPTKYYNHKEAVSGVEPAEVDQIVEPPIRHRRRAKKIQSALRQHFGYPGDEPITFFRRMVTWPRAMKLRYGRRYVDTLEWAGQGRLLDFGFGNGRFLRLQQERGWKIAGMDFNPEVVEHLTDKYGVEAESGSWPGPAFSGRQFDVITSWHVIEHLPDPVGYLKSAADRLAPGGYLQTCCPNGRSWSRHLFGRHWIGFDTPRHFSVFTKPQLIKLVEDAGLKFERHRAQARPGTMRSSSRIRAKMTGSLFWKIMSKQQLIWSVLARTSAWFDRCDCMIIIARKPEA